MRKDLVLFILLTMGCQPQQNVTKSSTDSVGDRSSQARSEAPQGPFKCDSSTKRDAAAITLSTAACQELKQLRATSDWISQRGAADAFPLQRDRLKEQFLKREFWKRDSTSEALEAIKDDLIGYYLNTGLESVSENVRKRAEDQQSRTPNYLPGLNDTWKAADEARLRNDFNEVTKKVKRGGDLDWNSTAIQQVIGNAGSYVLNMKTFGLMYAAKATAASAASDPEQLRNVESDFSSTVEIYLNLADLYALFVAYKILLAREAFPELMAPEVVR